MTKIDIKLLKDHKSFKAGFECNLEGDLIILTGVNGSGKSHLLEIIRQNLKEKKSEIKINDQTIQKNQIIFKSFKELINIAPFNDVQSNIRAKTIETACDIYKKIGLNINQISDQQQFSHINPSTLYLQSVAKFIDILKEKYPDKNRKLTEQDIEDAIPEDFIFQPDDIFSNNIIEIFMDFIRKRKEACEKRGQEGGDPYDGKELGDPPWTQLNKLFSELNFDYRFSDSYTLKNDKISPKVQLIRKKTGAEINKIIEEDFSIPLSDLSDGEKAIISLAFALIKNPYNTKLLLLDEYDATLNPSLTNSLFKVIETYFIKKGIVVIMTTHSTDTLMLAPEESSRYQIEKQSLYLDRIKKLDNTKYDDYKIVYKKYDKYNRDILDEAEKIKNELKEIKTPLIITEGKTDNIHIKTAIKKLSIIDLDIKFHEQDNSMGDDSLFELLKKLSSVEHPKKIIGIFDRDNPKYINSIGDLKGFGNNVFAFCIPLPDSRASYENISLEFYYSDDEIRKEKNGKRLYFSNEICFQATNRADKTPELRPEPKFDEEYKKRIFDEQISLLKSESDIPIGHSKTYFAELVADENDDFSTGFCFDNFNLIIDKIKEIINDATPKPRKDEEPILANEKENA